MSGKKKERSWEIPLALGLVALSALLYFAHWLIFHDAHHIFIYMVGDIAFVPIEVLLVTLIIHRVLEHRERGLRLKKMNMVIGTFFSEVGSSLLKQFRGFDRQLSPVEKDLASLKNHPETDFFRVAREIQTPDFQVQCRPEELKGLQHFLLVKREFLLRLLENPNLLEHDEFTELLWAVFHLAEELAFRADVTSLPPADHKHLLGDMNRAYAILVREWLAYMGHLKGDYPYLFSLALRLNPFDPEARAEVEK